MMTKLIDQVQGLARPRVMVVGDMLLDRYVWGKVRRISPEAPIQILKVDEEEVRLGGAANVARNMRSLGARVTLAGVIGNDPSGRRFLRLARSERIRTSNLVQDAKRPTSTKSRMMAQNQQMLRVDHEIVETIDGATQRRLVSKVRSGLRESDLVVISDYHKGTLPKSVTREVIRAAGRAKVPVLVGLKGRDHLKYRGATGAALNRAELRLISGCEKTEAGARRILDQLRLKFLVVTLGEGGLAVFPRKGRPVRLPTVARQVFDVTGAGDTVMSAFGIALASGLGYLECARIANVAAGIVVGKVGTAGVTREEIIERLRSGGEDSGSKILADQELGPVLERHRQLGRRIVFTNGCFDVLHAGHVKLLQFAKSQGDILVVGLNSDRSVRGTKGPRRPIIKQEERALVLSAIEACDYVVIFNEPTPDRIVRKLKPDILVKGEDWLHRKVVGSRTVRNRGGRIALAPIVRGLSSTGIIDRILEKYGTGSDGRKSGRKS
jgi:D-beta-D-heptose 7-phosphate kinase/D-beta-D-heptose 1-phosphate adenosyltransferase